MDDKSIIVTYCYDIVCPYAYIGSTRIEKIVQRVADECHNNNVCVAWQPVLLGGIYRNTKAPQGAAGSATDIMSLSKREWNGRDLLAQAKRHGVPIVFHPNHPVKSLNAMRLLTACPHEYRRVLTAELYTAYWVRNEAIDEIDVLRKYVKPEYGIADDWHSDASVKEALTIATRACSDKGAFGVPAIFVNDGPLIWGADRLHFVQMYVNNGVRAPFMHLPRYNLVVPRVSQRKSITMYFDFSSPWSFIGFTQVHRLRAVANVTLVPILLGAIFKSVGTSNVPMNSISDEKRQYMSMDMQRWLKWWKIDNDFRFPDIFPIRSVLPLRAAIVEPRITQCVYYAAWKYNRNIAQPEVLVAVLNEAGFKGKEIVESASHADIKQALRDNTSDALSKGVFGVPTYIVGDELVFGQDRLDCVLDMACEQPQHSRL